MRRDKHMQLNRNRESVLVFGLTSDGPTQFGLASHALAWQRADFAEWGNALRDPHRSTRGTQLLDVKLRPKMPVEASLMKASKIIRIVEARLRWLVCGTWCPKRQFPD
jgi:hypothetical protein